MPECAHIYCDQTFPPGDARRRYCSRVCKNNARAKRQRDAARDRPLDFRPCAFCGTGRITPPKKYCAAGCAWAAKTRQIAAHHNQRSLDLRTGWIPAEDGKSPMESAYFVALSHDPCAYCGEHDDVMTLDHIDPQSNGGAHHWTNATSACRSCNSSKHNRPLLVHLLAADLARQMDDLAYRYATITGTQQRSPVAAAQKRKRKFSAQGAGARLRGMGSAAPA